MSLIILITGSLAHAAQPIIVGLKGEAKVLSKTGVQLPSLIYEGEKYFYQGAKIGSSLADGSLVLCNNDCRVKVVYPSGTSVFVAPGAALRIIKATGVKQKDDSLLELLYGKMRAIVSKQKTSQWNVRTPAATSGVRGTDFTVRHSPVTGTEVAVLTGSVEFKPQDKPQQTTVIPAQKSVSESKGEYQVAPLTKAQVIAAYETTVVPVNNQNQEIKQLEDKSREVVIQEIKKNQPELFAQVQANPNMTSDELNRQMVQKPLEEAKPSATPSLPLEQFKNDLQNYQKYMDQ